MASSIAVLVLACAYQMLITSMTVHAVQRNATELQQGAMVPLARLFRELSETHPYHLRYDKAPAGVVFASPRDDQGAFTFDTAGNLNWQRYICYHLATVQGASALVRRELKLPAVVNAPPGIPYSTAWFAASSIRSTVVGPNVTGFTVAGLNPITITITVNHSALGRVDQLQYTTEVLIRNEGGFVP